MIKTILVPATGVGGDRPALDTAFLIGRRFGAHIECLHIRPTVEQMVMSAASDGGLTGDPGAEFVTETFEALKAVDRARSEKLRKTIESFRQQRAISSGDALPGQRGVTFALREVKGDEIEQTIAAARYHDLIVLGRSADAGELSVGNIGAVLIGCGRPVVLAPSPAPENLAPTIVIAWKETPEAARAVTAAMPLLAKADKIVVLVASEHGDKTDARLESGKRLAAQLRQHGFAADARDVTPGKRSFADAVIDTAGELGADLLVMGAYGHSRIRELVLGGFTRDVLKACPMPVFLFH